MPGSAATRQRLPPPLPADAVWAERSGAGTRLCHRRAGTHANAGPKWTGGGNWLVAAQRKAC
jgi:hypothetical protein